MYVYVPVRVPCLVCVKTEMHLLKILGICDLCRQKDVHQLRHPGNVTKAHHWLSTEGTLLNTIEKCVSFLIFSTVSAEEHFAFL